MEASERINTAIRAFPRPQSDAALEESEEEEDETEDEVSLN